jgi:hypothetical protein
VKPNIHYLNTDLEIVSRDDPQPLVAALTLRDLWLLGAFQKEDGSWFANFETCAEDDQPHDQPEPDVLEMLEAIESLGGTAKDFWASCISRNFSIGYEGGEEPKAVEHELGAATLARMSALGISLHVSLYPPAPPP